MPSAAFMTTYRDETVAAYERDQSLLRVGCYCKAQTKGNQAVILVAGSDGGDATTRGVNGYIPYGQASNTQVTLTLEERHGTHEITGFDVFSSQGDQRQIMQTASLTKIHRNVDNKIVAALDTATLTAGASQQADLDLVTKATAILGANNVKVEEDAKMFAAITPSFRAYLMQTTEFSSGDYVDVKPFNGPVRKMWKWAGINWIVTTALTGMGTNDEYCYLWHQDAIAHIANTNEMKVEVDYDRKQDLSWARASMFHAAKVLQNTGIIRMRHDGSAHVAV